MSRKVSLAEETQGRVSSSEAVGATADERLNHRLTEMIAARKAFIDAKLVQVIAENQLLKELVAQNRMECLAIKYSALRRLLPSKHS